LDHFTDGSFEPSSPNPVAVGAVLVSPSGIVSEFFGEWVQKQVVDQLLIFSDHPIYELEILPFFLAATVWGQYIANSLVVVFLDNDQPEVPISKGLPQQRQVARF